MKNRVYTVFVIVTCLCTYFIFGFTQFGAHAYAKVFQKGNTYEEKTRVASLAIEGKTAREAEAMLTDAVNTWLAESKVMLTYNGKEIALPSNTYQFKIQETLDNLAQGQENGLVVAVESDLIKENVEAIGNATLAKHIDYNKVEETLRQNAATFVKEQQIDLANFIVIDEKGMKEVSKVSMPIKALEKAVGKWQEFIPKMTIPANSNVSILDLLGDNHVYFTSKELSMIVSYFYQLVSPTNFEVIERQISRELPTYAKLGYEVRIDKKEGMDFVFYNPNTVPYEVTFAEEGANFVMKLQGMPFMYQYKVVQENKKNFQPRQIIQYNAALDIGQSKLVTPGVPGQLVQMMRLELDEAGNIVTKEMLAEDFYPPVASVLERSIQAKQDTTPDGKDDGKDDGTTPDGEEDEEESPGVDGGK